MITVVYHQSAPPRLSAPPPPIFPHRKNWYRECAPPPLFICLPLFSKLLMWQCSYISPLGCLFCEIEGTNNGSLEMGIILCRRARHDHHNRCRPVSVTVIFRQWRGRDTPSQHCLSTSCSPLLKLAPVPHRSITAHVRSRTSSAI